MMITGKTTTSTATTTSISSAAAAATGILFGSSGDEIATHTSIISAGTATGGREGSSEAGLVVGVSNRGDEGKGIRELHHDQLVVYDGDRNFGGNRWPRQETLDLLRIRSDMDVTFRDASVKGPLWDEVSRKLGELGYNRSAKKCKEKFENVFKYHKRTKEGRTGKSEGKTYRFFDQLEALNNQLQVDSQMMSSSTTTTTTTVASQKPLISSLMATTLAPPVVNVSSTVPNVAPVATTTTMAAHSLPLNTNLTVNLPPPLPVPSSLPPPPPLSRPQSANPPPSSSFPNISMELLSNSTSSSTSSDVEFGRGRGRGKRKWKDFFDGLMNEVINKQEQLQKKFLEAIEKREHENAAREEAWRMQEMARINREREILAQERSVAAAKDAALLSFLQKLSEEQNSNLYQVLHTNPVQPPPPPPPQPQPQSQSQQPPPPPPVVVISHAVSAPPSLPAPAPAPAPAPPPLAQPTKNMLDLTKAHNEDQNFPSSPSSSRWPKVEVSALIRLRSILDAKYQDNGPKGPLWEEISAGMRNLGYNRNSKRCKEKWENINKYFKKVKESNKKRPEDSKTCPYYHELEALYREKGSTISSSNQLKTEATTMPLMVQPEQQWPPTTTPTATIPSTHHRHRPDLMMDDLDHNQEDDDDYDDEEEDDDNEGGGYEIVPNKGVSIGRGE